eukprot:IDg17391t1
MHMQCHIVRCSTGQQAGRGTYDIADRHSCRFPAGFARLFCSNASARQRFSLIEHNGQRHLQKIWDGRCSARRRAAEISRFRVGTACSARVLRTVELHAELLFTGWTPRAAAAAAGRVLHLEGLAEFSLSALFIVQRNVSLGAVFRRSACYAFNRPNAGTADVH